MYVVWKPKFVTAPIELLYIYIRAILKLIVHYLVLNTEPISCVTLSVESRLLHCYTHSLHTSLLALDSNLAVRLLCQLSVVPLYLYYGLLMPTVVVAVVC